MEAVKFAWHRPLQDGNLFHRLDWLLCNTAQVLHSWSDRVIGNIRLQLSIAQELVLCLECARDHHHLAPHEES
jgi:hypothetical protein